MVLLRTASCLLLAGVIVVAQSSPRFEVAAVRAASDQGDQVNAGLRITDNQVRVTGLSLQNYIAMAYRVKPSQVLAPEWASQLRFDVTANLPAGASREQVPEMLQALLADRFQLKVRRDNREFPVYMLSVAKSGLKITGTPVDAAPVAAAVVASGNGSAAGVTIAVGDSVFTLAANKVDVRKMTMARLAESLTRFTDRTVVDATSLTDRYDFSLDLTPEDYQLVLIRAGVNGGVSLPPQALRFLDVSPPNPLGPYFEKVGLTLESGRAPLEVLVVDSALKTPLEN